MNYPRHFNSLAEYQGYKKCLEKCKLGDKVEGYVFPSNGEREYYTSRIPTEHSRIATIIGFKDDDVNRREKAWLLGSNDPDLKFWSIENERRNGGLYTWATKLSVHTFTKAFWLFVDDLRAKKVFRH